ncbi:glycerophosphodiester phosphodiesterase family protein [Corynebacterium pseudopelargi]|uniref:Putative glycerophosphoryl diester phosphodiesterase 1 n=1 Tax=Corynebacterium pseudopelargi TaxID=2080757 RepID=A0A3G6IRW3_9CORY|nr:glycerophosphodiester phosphodiesterase family protein [Corynebacterium pseudopelargi]AZA08296.1 putative glycerophosphoryl diester phosphodiesterase 1 [Corynebacterium pseudopelargi]
MHIIAHRGFSSRYTEMSAEAYEKALELPIHGVECDVRLSKDGQLMCFHDPTLLRMFDDPRRVASTSSKELSALGVLRLDELLDMVLAYPNRHLYIEAKHPTRFGRMLEEQIVLRLCYRKLVDDPRMHYISFSTAGTRRMAKLAPKMHTVRLLRDWEWCAKGQGISLVRGRANPEKITANTYMFTVNEPEDIRWAQQQGLGMLATDAPDVALSLQTNQ